MNWLWRLFVLCAAVLVVSGVMVALVAPPTTPPSSRAPTLSIEGRLNSFQRERPTFTAAAWVELLRNAIIIAALVVVVAPFVPLLRKPTAPPRKP